MTLISAHRELVWQQWDEAYVVYQLSSTETHVFNETTALILRCLEQGPLSMEQVKDWAEAALDIGHGELVAGDFAFAVARLEELGLVERLDETVAVR
jgi:PqqD family protein of HPr-rel-A system